MLSRRVFLKASGCAVLGALVLGIPLRAEGARPRYEVVARMGEHRMIRRVPG